MGAKKNLEDQAILIWKKKKISKRGFFRVKFKIVDWKNYKPRFLKKCL